jgi:hypothetical protein
VREQRITARSPYFPGCCPEQTAEKLRIEMVYGLFQFFPSCSVLVFIDEFDQLTLSRQAVLSILSQLQRESMHP